MRKGDCPGSRRRDDVSAILSSFVKSDNPERAREVATAPTYDDLLRENQELKLALSHANPSATNTYRLPSTDKGDAWEKLIFSELQPSAAAIQVSWPNPPLPSRELSSRLLHHDKLWNSWVHYGLQYPRFEHEHESFWDGLETGGSLDDCDPFWLAIYFAVLSTSLLSIDSDELADLSLPRGIWLASP